VATLPVRAFAHAKDSVMDADHFDSLARSLCIAGSRRRALVAILGGALGVVVGASPVRESLAEKKKGKKKKSCSQCKKRKNGQCKPRANGTACRGDGTCQRGRCKAPFCAGRNSCEDGNPISICQRAGAAEQCVCVATADTGAPFCAQNNAGSGQENCLVTPCDAGETCIDFTGGACTDDPVGGTACALPCPEPL
jgi:hypothetical protein